MGNRQSTVESLVSHAGFWRGKRVLVTGHTGFKGGWLTLWLNSLGADVTGLALQPATQPNLFFEAGLAGDCTSRIVDVRDAHAVAEVVRVASPEIAFHLAAQPLVRASYDEPAATWMTNVMGTIALLDALRRTNTARAIVVVTSDKCYEQSAATGVFREGDALGGHDPYSSSKAAAEIATASWRRSFFDAAPGGMTTGVATARAGNVIGGGDWAADRLIPDLVRGAMKGSSVPIRYPRATRPWQHVLDPVRGYLMLAERLAHEPRRYGGAWNFGPEAEGSIPVADVAERFAKALDRGARWHVAEDASLHEAATLALDSTKAREDLGWRPRWTIAEAIARTADAYRVALDRGDFRTAMLDQIAAHRASLEVEVA